MKSKFNLILIVSLIIVNPLFCRDRKVVKSVLILGNSIVAHPPLPEIGWYGDWGMAASQSDSDFVHILKSKILEIDPSIKVTWESISEFERNFETYNFKNIKKSYNNDIIIIKISENVKYEENTVDSFIENYDRLIRFLSKKDAQIIIAEGFWPTPINDLIKGYANENKIPFVELSDLYVNDKSNTAVGLFENKGVSDHPSDKGMRNIANRIWDITSKYF